MTEKRFISKEESIINVATDELVNANSEESAEIIIMWLNEQHEEIQSLKKEIENNIDSFKRSRSRRIQAEEENEQLKQYIYDNLDENICDVCSYQYLEKSQMDKYYVAKCKKGYDNCSKGTVIHCKDFKFKRLIE